MNLKSRMMNKKLSIQQHGEVFTNIEVVKYLLDEVEYNQEFDLRNVKILEPSCGLGAFADEIIRRLIFSSIKFKFNFIEALNTNIRFIDINTNSIEYLKNNTRQLIKKFGFNPNLIDDTIYINNDYLQYNFHNKFDCIVGNPPYIRHENIDSSAKEIYRKKYKTFKYRADIYIPFYEKSLDLLTSRGKLSFICSNRWLYNQYGRLLREKVANDFQLSKLLNIEKSNPFNENVVAYPCVTTITTKQHNNNYTYYYTTNDKIVNLQAMKFKQVNSPKDDNWSNLFLEYDINHNSLSGILEQGFKIGIGVATGADKVFIRHENEINGIEQERLIPIIVSKSLKGNEINWNRNYVINPFEQDKLCNLDDYTNLKKYLHKNKDILMQRHIAKKNPTNWYKTIDKIKLDLIGKPKLLLPDLAQSKFIHLDKGNYYPHHNVYYITNENVNKLKILACLLMSKFVKKQLSDIGIKMNGGLPRFQSQTLKKLKIPIIEKLSLKHQKELINSYNNKNISIINKIINKYCHQLS